MATTTSANSRSIPCLENGFGVLFLAEDHWSYRFWKTQPDILFDNQEFVDVCKRYYDSTPNAPGSMFYRSRDVVIERVITLFDFQDLINFSEVSKCCYLVIKTHRLWEIQFQKIFPQIKPLPEDSYFSVERQFKIYLSERSKALATYRGRFNRNNDMLKSLIGAYGSGGRIWRTRKAYKNHGGEEANTRFFQALQAASTPEEIQEVWSSPDAKAYSTRRKLSLLTSELKYLAGVGYDGVCPFTPSSQQARCLKAINELIPRAFEDQERFKKCMQEIKRTIDQVT